MNKFWKIASRKAQHGPDNFFLMFCSSISPQQVLLGQVAMGGVDLFD